MNSYITSNEKEKEYYKKSLKKDKNYDTPNIQNSISQINTNVSIFEIEDLSNRENMISYINKNNSSFFEKFDLLEFINSGSIGYVYRGKYKSNKKIIALKFLINRKNKEKRDEKEKQREIKEDYQEIEISKKLHHKNIIEIFAYYKAKNGYNFSVLEYARHGDLEYFLKKLLKRNMLSETSLNYFGKQILEALQYLHRCKIIHMDIKPGNILIDLNLNAKLTDFSVSCSFSSFHNEDLVNYPFVGTGKFMAPEIISKINMKIKDSEKIDIFSLGVSLYYLFYGDYPYKLKNVKNKDYEGILNNIKQEELEFPDNRKISELFKDFLTKMLEKDYTKRLSIRQALAHPWMLGSQIIFDEKEKIYSHENFLIKLITDNIPKFNEYIKLKSY